ncbi:MAG: glycosyltransferase family 4 protein [Muribaculaceae bacterium]|nr:glycosyltransferase family 4 protein [Muribaculaceae bacterium]
MKLAIIITDITGNGGIERTSTLIANTFYSHGNDVSIVSLFRKNLNLCFPINPGIKIIYSSEDSYSFADSILKKIKVLFSTRKKLKNILQQNDFDEILCQAFLPSFLCATLGYLSNITACEHFKYELYGKIGTLIRNNIYKRCKHVITLTKKDSIKFFSQGVKNSVIPNMLTFPVYKNIGHREKTIVAAGRLSKQKGFDLLIKAMQPIVRRYPDWHLNIYGAGECERDLKELLLKLNLSDNVHLKGFNSKISEVFRVSSFFVLSSRFEGFPMILLEAASQNLPCISFDCPEGPAEILKNGAGLIVEKENISELSKAILKFIEDPLLRENCAKQALINILEYSPEKIYNKWLSVFSNEQ